MSRRLPYTPNSRIRSVLRVLWLRSRERAQALKNTNYSCCGCGVRQSKAKGREVALDVHHLDGVTNWEKIFGVIRSELLVDPARLAPMCEACHREWEEKKQCLKAQQAEET